MAEPSIEFFIPFYGDPDYLVEAVESLRAMTDPAWRATVLDDCYPHADVARRLAPLGDERVTVRRNSVNLGVNANFRAAVAAATADYVVILGGDDRVRPHYLERVRETISRTSATIVQPGAVVIDERGVPHLPLGDRVKRWLAPRPRDVGVYRGALLAASLATGNWTYFPSLCWHRETVQRIGFRGTYEVVPDLALIFDVLLDGGTLAVDPTVTFEYRRHRASVSSMRARTGERFDEESAYLTDIAAEFEHRGWPFAALAARARLTSRLNAGLTAVSLARRDGATARRLARRALT